MFLDMTEPGPGLNTVIMRALKEFSDQNKGQANLDSPAGRLMLAKLLTSDEVKAAYAKDASKKTMDLLKAGTTNSGHSWVKKK